MGNPFAVVQGAKVSKNGVKFAEGNHLVRIKACKLVQSQQYNTQYFVPECELLESDNPSMHVGVEYSDTYGLNELMGPSNIKKFAAAVCGVDPIHPDAEDKIAAYWSEVREQQMDFPEVLQDWVSDDNPLGVLEVELWLTAKARVSKKNHPYMAVEWHPRDVD